MERCTDFVSAGGRVWTVKKVNDHLKLENVLGHFLDFS